MTILTLTTEPPPELAAALDRFERQFQYPLGPGRSFRVSHGRRYLPFFQAMGEARILVATDGANVFGTLAIVTRRLTMLPCQDSATAVHPVQYLCDLKIAPGARGGAVLASLFEQAGEIVRNSRSHACYAVVMQGTGRLPVEYTGRLGVPPFREAGRIVVLRLTPKEGVRAVGERLRFGSEADIESAGQLLSNSGVAVQGGQTELRSRMTPVPCTDATGTACGVIEDTLLGKRLLVGEADELISAHLTDFRWKTGAAGGRFLESAAHYARDLGYPALFAAVPENRLGDLRPHLERVESVEAPAIVYGHQVPTDREWWINTAEI